MAVQSAAGMDIAPQAPEVRRHSSFSTADRNKLDYFYKTAFGSAIKGL
jgi:hypothetical protein